MKFFNMPIGQNLILITATSHPIASYRPIRGRSATPPTPWIIRLVLCLVAQFAPIVAHWPPPAWEINKARFAVLAIVVVALVEVLAQNHIEKALGVIT